MIDKSSFQYYANSGDKVEERHRALNDPAGYKVDKDLRNAVNAALILGQPMLITGEPGTGKTQLAHRVAAELNLPLEVFPLTFNTKTTSTAKDLLYRYDALRHFNDTQIAKRHLPVSSYISYEALGLAILLSYSPDDPKRKKVNSYLPAEVQELGPMRSVVLIDEIDKAPRDLPNDILNEIENMSFDIPELADENEQKSSFSFKADQQYRPIVILTSNSERDLPNPFLRRVVFYHIEFPGDKRLLEIVEARHESSGLRGAQIMPAIYHFLELRRLNLIKQPATAELLSWVYILSERNIDVTNENKLEDLTATYNILSKNEKDIKEMRAEALNVIKRAVARNKSSQ